MSTQITAIIVGVTRHMDTLWG